VAPEPFHEAPEPSCAPPETFSGAPEPSRETPARHFVFQDPSGEAGVCPVGGGHRLQARRLGSAARTSAAHRKHPTRPSVP
jgi:hypothetical protein